MKVTPLVRDCEASDLREVVAIYGYYVCHGTGTFETDPPEMEEIKRRWTDVRSRGLPFLVAERDRAVVGFAYAAPFRLRAAYRFTAEDSVYVDPKWVGQKVGTALLSTLIERTRTAGITQLLALIGDAENAASIRLHQSLGFRQVGVLEQTGYKFGQWLDVVLMQLTLVSTPPTEATTGGRLVS